MAPAVLLLETLRKQRIDGVAIALTSTALFLLVLARMSRLLRRIEERAGASRERNRAARLVLDTVNEGLLRVSADGALAEERSAMIDRWFGPFAGARRWPTTWARVDGDFATWFRLRAAGLARGGAAARAVPGAAAAPPARRRACVHRELPAGGRGAAVATRGCCW